MMNLQINRTMDKLIKVVEVYFLSIKITPIIRRDIERNRTIAYSAFVDHRNVKNRSRQWYVKTQA
jgi:hypothetical protein